MGFNTVAVMMNDETPKWPAGMVRAMNDVSCQDGLGFFPGGQVISCAHASHTQIVAVGGNTGYELSALDPVKPEHLEELSQILRAHGYTVRKPGRSRGDGPLDWGYAAQQARKAEQEASKDADPK